MAETSGVGEAASGPADQEEAQSDQDCEPGHEYEGRQAAAGFAAECLGIGRTALGPAGRVAGDRRTISQSHFYSVADGAALGLLLENSAEALEGWLLAAGAARGGCPVA